MNLNTLDLNLLKAFDALYRERHVGRAAAAIGLAQPSMSNALNRLRAQFDDPLFQRGAGCMTPTVRAEELAPKVTESLTIIAQMLEQSAFDPMTVEGQVVVSASDLAILRLAPEILGHFERHAPRLNLRFVPMQKTDIVAKLDSGEVMLAIGTFGHLPARFHRQTVMPDSFICIARKDHPLTRNGLTLDAFLAARHYLMTLKDDKIGVVDRELKRLGHRRRVVMTCAQFSLLPDIVANSDGIATVPTSLRSVAERAGCDVFEVPLALPNWASEMVWTQKTEHDPLGRFVIQSLRETL